MHVCKVVDAPDFIDPVLGELQWGEWWGRVRCAEENEVEPARGGIVNPFCGKEPDGV